MRSLYAGFRALGKSSTSTIRPTRTSTLAKSSHLIVGMHESPAPRSGPQRGVTVRGATATNVEENAERISHRTRATGITVIRIMYGVSAPRLEKEEPLCRNCRSRATTRSSPRDGRGTERAARTRREQARECRPMRKNKDWNPSATFIAAFSAVSAVCVLGAACHFDALIGSGRKGGGGSGGGGGGSGLASVAQLRSDMRTPIPTGGSTPEPTIVVKAVVRDTTVATPRVEVEIRPVGTDFQGQPNATSAATPRGDTALVQVSGLQDNTGYHWQARMEGDTAWQPYGGNAENAADLRVALPVATNHLEFTQNPTTTTAGATMTPVKVTLKDGQGNVITSFTGNVHLG